METKRVAIIGSGTVGQQLGLGFLKLGWQVKIGTRDPNKLDEWLSKAGEGASVGSFRDAALFGDIAVLCTKWEGTPNAITLCGLNSFNGKVVIDVTNPLVFGSGGEAPKLDEMYPNSAGAKIQRLLPGARVVKAFNIVTAHYMTNPKLQEGSPDMFICGNDKEAKNTVAGIARAWSWDVHDIGNIEQAYLLESLAMLWIRWGFLNNHWTHAFKLLKK